jgi:hypothetical protein
VVEPQAVPTSSPAIASGAPKPDAREELLRELVTAMKGSMVAQETLVKEYTKALIENTKSLQALRFAIHGVEPTPEQPDGEDGLMDMVDDLGQAAEDLDSRMTGMNLILARYSWAFDRMLEIQKGDAEAPAPEEGKEPAPGVAGRESRVPTFIDLIAALREFDKTAEEEAVKEMEEEDRLKKEAEERRGAPAPSAKPAKPAMLSNSAKPPPPVFRALPPAPMAPPKPAGAK